MPLFEQTFLKPGKYHVGGGAFRVYDRDTIARYVAGTKRLLARGHHVPVLLEHAAPGSDEGSPRDNRAAQVRHGVGWLKDVAIGGDGAATSVLEVTDPAIAKKIAEGSIQFSSPEFRRHFVDGKGESFEEIIAHVALTHKPRAKDQSPLAASEEVAQFSLADLVQMADDEPPAKDDGEDETPAPASDPPKNPDLPTQTEGDQQFQAALAHLRECFGIDLPSDATPETGWRDLLTALKTYSATKQKLEAEEPKDDEENPDEPMIEDRPPMQFSLADCESGKVANKLLARVIAQEHERLRARTDKLVDAGRITPALRERLFAPEHLQFSSEGGESLPALSIERVVGLLEETAPAGFAWLADATQFSAIEKPGANPEQEQLAAAARVLATLWQQKEQAK